VTAGKRCDPVWVALLLLAVRGPDLSAADADSRDFLLIDSVVLVDEPLELVIRKPATTTGHKKTCNNNWP
jgi:hypothetical protein